MINIIGLYGDSRAGKDSVARFLSYDFDFEQRNMADPIRDILLNMNLNLVDNRRQITSLLSTYVEEHGWDQTKTVFPDVVDWMIGLGQAARDFIGQNVWLEAVLKDRPDQLVIADVRQVNEYAKILELGGQVWKVTRPGTEPRGMDRLLEDLVFQAHVNNNGDLVDLRATVQIVFLEQIDKVRFS